MQTMINSLAIVQAHGSLNASNAKAFQVRLFRAKSSIIMRLSWLLI